MATTRTSVKVTAALLVAFVFVALLEVGARILSPGRLDEISAASSEISQRIYSAEELDGSIPRRLERQGGDCVSYRHGMYWSQWWGFWDTMLDSKCAKKLFSAHPIKVALFGGSSMANLEAPNYRTHLDYLAFGADDRIASVNLAESSARLSNMVARLIHEGIDLKPDVAVFLDGMNEFSSVLYGGQPGDDFYWTAGVKSRVEKPSSLVVDKLTEVSALARIVLIQSGLFTSARLQNRIEAPSPLPDVQIYLRDREVAQALCRNYDIECVFILQPSAFTTVATNKNAAKVAALHDRVFPFDHQVISAAYSLLRKERCDNCVDASNLFDDVDDAFFDAGHFTKNGGAKLGALIHEEVVAAYARKLARN